MYEVRFYDYLHIVTELVVANSKEEVRAVINKKYPSHGDFVQIKEVELESAKINCEKPDELLEAANKVVAKMHSRIKLISAMHEIMKSMNNEDAYMEWIYIVPDEPSEDDFRSIAESDEDMAECEEAFFRIIKKYGKDGLFYYQKY